MTEGARSQDHPAARLDGRGGRQARRGGPPLAGGAVGRSADGDVWADATAEDHIPAECRGCPYLPGTAGAVRRQPGGLRAPGRRRLVARRGAAGAGHQPRRPPVSLTIGVDVGGTKVAGGVVDEKGEILAQHRVDTPARDAEATTSAITSVDRLAAGRPRDRGGRHRDRRLRGRGPRRRSTSRPTCWAGADGPLRDEVEKRVGLPVVVENDANAAAWGEARFGAGREEHFIVCVTVGTGIGGGIIVDRQLFRGGFGVGAEIGHIQMVEDGRPCGCGQRGCWEQYASGGALVREARARAAEAREDALSPARPRRRDAGGHHRRARHPGGPRGRPGRQGRVRHARPLARPGAGRPRCGPRPGVLRARRRGLGGGRVRAHADRSPRSSSC